MPPITQTGAGCGHLSARRTPVSARIDAYICNLCGVSWEREAAGATRAALRPGPHTDPGEPTIATQTETRGRGSRLYGHGRLVNGRWIRDSDKPPSPIKMLREEVEELKLLEERLKSWVRWWVKEKMKMKAKGRVRRRRTAQNSG